MIDNKAIVWACKICGIKTKTYYDAYPGGWILMGGEDNTCPECKIKTGEMNMKVIELLNHRSIQYVKIEKESFWTWKPCFIYGWVDDVGIFKTVSKEEYISNKAIHGIKEMKK